MNEVCKMPDPKNNQEVFDFVVSNIRQQGCRSRNDEFCAYRGKNGTKCAAGWLIPDKEYIPEMEEWGSICEGNSPNFKENAKNYFLDKGYDINLLIGLQRAHDIGCTGAIFIDNFNKECKNISDRFGLKYS